jgi:ribonuclease HII
MIFKKIIAGVDEVGRGPLAGPVVAAAVIIDFGEFPDSKKLTQRGRERLFGVILANASAVSVCAVSPYIIDALDIRKASLLAMRDAIESLEIRPDLALIDGRDRIPQLQIEQIAVIGGDALHYQIGAASIVAKVARDALLKCYGNVWCGFSFEGHKGYPTKAHYDEIAQNGERIIHRSTFRLR